MSATARRLVLLALLVLACASPPGAQADPGRRHQDNVATAVIEQDGGRASDLAFEVITQRGGDVDNLNAAEAAARCTGCRATAIAFQVVLASGRPEHVVPENRAVAINHTCTECVVIAEARQFVRVVDEPVKLTGAGRAELDGVRAELRALAAQDLPFEALDAAVEAQEARVRDVLAHELVPKRDPDGAAEVLDRQASEDSDT